jgi:hypothetical protein
VSVTGGASRSSSTSGRRRRRSPRRRSHDRGALVAALSTCTTEDAIDGFWTTVICHERSAWRLRNPLPEGWAGDCAVARTPTRCERHQSYPLSLLLFVAHETMRLCVVSLSKTMNPLVYV